MTYAIHEHETVQVLQVTDLFNELDNRIILQNIKQLIEKGSNDFVIDLSQLKFMNSVGLNFLISMMTTSKASGGFLALANPNQQIITLLEITKLKNMFNLSDTVEEAYLTIGKSR
jgi:anti-sigma B factor antagonist